MDISRAQMAYDAMEPEYKDVSDKVDLYADAYEKAIREAIVNGLPYGYTNVMGHDKARCPVAHIADEIWSEHELCRDVITSVVQGAPNEEIGAKFTKLVKTIIDKIAIELAQDHVTAEEE